MASHLCFPDPNDAALFLVLDSSAQLDEMGGFRALAFVG